MRSAAQRLVPVVAVLALGLTGCAGAGDGVQDRLVDVTNAANARDADGLREAADDLVDELRARQQAGDLDQAELDRLTQLADQVRADADLIDQDLLDVETSRQEAELAEQQAEDEKARREQAEQELREAEERAQEQSEGGDDDGKPEKDEDGKKDDKKDDEQDDG